LKRKIEKYEKHTNIQSEIFSTNISEFVKKDALDYVFFS